MDSRSESSRETRGSLTPVGKTGAVHRQISFQFNPDSLTRQLQRHGAVGQSGGAAGARRLWGAPSQTITMTVELEAADVIVGESAGDITPDLAALELLLYPSSASVEATDNLLAKGTVEILPERAPLVLLAWGTGRQVPVQLDSLQITEQAFDPKLRPVRASVELSLRVLTYDDLLPGDSGRATFLDYHKALEGVSKVGQGNPATAGATGAAARSGAGRTT